MLAPGTTVGRYVVQRKLAEGGMAEIYLASAVGPEGFSKDVVIKVVRSFLATDQQFVQMFIAEARLASRLNHANVVQIFDFGKHEDTYFLAMEFIRGGSLWDLRKRCREFGVPFPPVLAAEICAQVARGLQYAHNLTENGQKIGVVHRDVTPHNVLLSFDGAVKLTDFGIAKATTSQTAPGMLKGKFAYMSPEQGRGEKVDNRTDIFALGIVLWELLTGGRLFDGDTDVAVLRAVQDSLIAPPARLNPDVQQDLSDIVMKALARKADERFQNAFELDRALSTFVLKNAQTVEDTSVGQFLQQLFREEFAGHTEQEPSHLRPAPSPALVAPPDDFGRGDTAFVDRGKKTIDPTMTGTPVKLVPQRATPQPLARELLLRTEPEGVAAKPPIKQPGVGGDEAPAGGPLTEQQPGVGRPSRPSTEQMPAHRPSKTPSRRFDPLPIGSPSVIQPAVKLPATVPPRSAPIVQQPREDVEPPLAAPRSKTPFIVGGVALLGVALGLAGMAFTHAEQRAGAQADGAPTPGPSIPSPEANPVVRPPPEPAGSTPVKSDPAHVETGEATPPVKASPVKPPEPLSPVPASTPEPVKPATASPAKAKDGNQRGPQPGPVSGTVKSPPSQAAAPVTRYGSLTVMAVPWAILTVNGRSLGEVSAMRTLRLPVGPTTLEFVKNSVRRTEHVVIKEGETVSVEFDGNTAPPSPP